MALLLAVVPIAAASGSGIIAAVYAGFCERTKRWIKKTGLWSEKKNISKVGLLKPGDHICYTASISSLMYHHAIVTRVIDDDTVEVIHYSGPPAAGNNNRSSSFNPSSSISTSTSSGSMNKKTSVVIRKDKEDLSQVAKKGKLYRVTYEKDGNCYPPDVVVDRAQSKLGEPGLQRSGYHLFRNNCEHFATWCKTGAAFSQQSGLKHD